MNNKHDNKRSWGEPVEENSGSDRTHLYSLFVTCQLNSLKSNPPGFPQLQTVLKVFRLKHWGVVY